MGGYEVYKTGTTLAQLKADVLSMTQLEYFDSFVTIVDNDLNVGHLILRPNDARTYYRGYEATKAPYNINSMAVSWIILIKINENDITYKKFTQPVSGTYSEVTPTVSSYTIYKRK